MTYKVVLSPHAARDYRKLPPDILSQVRDALDVLTHEPIAGAKIKQLKGRLHAYHRYRVGDYRVVYVADRAAHVVYVDYIQHRRDVYRDIDPR